jgi:hypothetical protein
MGAMVLAGASGADAGVYTVHAPGSCEDDKPRTPFTFATSDPATMEAFAQCGIGASVITRSRPGGALRTQAHAEAVFEAPEGTTLERVTFDAEYGRIDCHWSVQLVAWPTIVAGVSAFNRCDVLQDFEAGTVDNLDATTLVQEVRCVDDVAGCPAAEEPGVSSAYFGLRSVQIDVNDEVPPRIERLSLGGPPDQWIKGVQPLQYVARDSSGIEEARLSIAGQAPERHPAACDFTRAAPCPDGGGDAPLDTTKLPDGVHPITVAVVDAGGNVTTDSLSAHVDNTPPASVQAVLDGGSGWRRQNAFTLSWSAAPEDYAPVSAAHYRLCRPGTTECVRGVRPGKGIDRLADLRVPGAGEWTLETWREDAAGNADERLASPPMLLRFDDAPPAFAFEPHQADNPRRVSALVTDGASGVAGADLQLRRAGTAAWQPLPARFDGRRIVADIDDDRLPAGTYELRAAASDRAGNDGSASTRLELPLRARPRLKAGIVQQRGRKTRLAGRARVRFGAKLKLSGRLTNQAGRPIASARLIVATRPRGGSERPVDTVTTNGSGEFAYALRARASGTVFIRYPGSRLLGKAERKIALGVRAASVLKVNSRTVLNGDEVVFTGRLRGRPFPRPGKIIHLQAHFGRKGWTNFGKPHRAEPNGRWRIPYRFDNTRGIVHYRFRVLVPRERDYPFETGASNIVRVTVRGR